MNFEHVSIDLLKSLPRNARKHSTRNLDVIKQSLKECGQQKPIVINEDNVVLAGNGTMAAAKSLGWDKLWVSRTTLDKSRADLFAILDNRSAELAEWDAEDLTFALDELDNQGWDLKDFGWDQNDRNHYKFKDAVAGLIADDEIPEVKDTRCKPGDLWLLGDHRLLCGDSSDVLLLGTLMENQFADLVFTDPPYRQDTTSGGTGRISRCRSASNRKIEHLCDFEPEAFLSSLTTVFAQNKMNAYIFCNKDLVPDYLGWAVKAGYNFNILFWKKSHAMPLAGNHFPDVEYLLLFRKSGIFNSGLKDVSYSKCLQFKREHSEDHPTMKPVELITNELFISSNPGSVVCDFFLGSGSTLIACEKTSRKCFGMEIDPKYCDIILARWEKFTGKTAFLSTTESSTHGT